MKGIERKRLRQIADGDADCTDSELVQIAEELLAARVTIADRDRAAEYLVRAMYLYGGYTVGTRGPSGCLMGALEVIAPDVAAEIRDTDDVADAYRQRWGEDEE